MIGSVGTFSGPAGQIFKDSVDAVAVWVKWTNARGGINGHLIQRHFCWATVLLKDGRYATGGSNRLTCIS